MRTFCTVFSYKMEACAPRLFLSSSLNMSKMATLFEDKKTVKNLQVVYFTAKPNEPLQLKTKVNELTTKEYKKRETITGGEKSRRNDRLGNTDLRKLVIRTNSFKFRGHHHLALERAPSSAIRNYKGPNFTGVSIRGDLYGWHAVRVSKKTRQKVRNLAHLGQKVSNPTKLERGESVGRGAAPRPRSPDARSSAKLLRGSNKPSENTGLRMARRPQEHDDEPTHPDKVRTKVHTTKRGGEPQTREHRNKF